MRRFAVAATFCLVLGGLGALLVALAEPAPAPARYRFVPPREPAFDFKLKTEEGTPTSIRDARGKVVAMTFLYSTCRDLCPAEAVLIAKAVGRVGPGVLVYGVSVDPVGDTPARAKAFMRSRGLPPSLFKFLIGSRKDLAPVWAAYGIAPVNATPEEALAAAQAADKFRRDAAKAKGPPPKAAPYAPPVRDAPPAAGDEYPDPTDLSYRGRSRHSAGLDFEHSAYVMLIDKHGRQRVGLPFEQLDVDGLATDLEALLHEP
jgi:protein SCO1/2